MKFSPRIAVWFQALVVIGCFSALKAEVKPGSYTAADVRGTVTWTDPSTKAEAPLASGQKLPQGAIVSTGEGSTVVLVFASGATATLAPESSVEVSRFYQQAFSEEAFLNESLEPSVSVTEMNLIRGEITGQVRKLRTGSEFVVNTPVGAAGVRGTTFSVSYNPNNGLMIIKTATGLVVYISIDGNELLVPAGRKYTTDGEVEELTPEEIAEIVAVANAAVEAALEERAASGSPRRNPVNVTITVPDPDEVSGSQP